MDGHQAGSLFHVHVIVLALNNAGAHVNVFFSKGCSSEEAQEEYMKIVKGWAGFGATMFDVVVSRCYFHYFGIFRLMSSNSSPL